MGPTLLKLVAAALAVALAWIVVRDFRLGRAPGFRSGFAVRYAQRDETPLLFWILTIGRAAVIAIVVVTLFNWE
jgi:hypothetical protein